MAASREADVPTPLHKELNWHIEEIALCKTVMAEVEAKYAPSPEKDEALARIRASLKAHQEVLAELEKKLAQGT